MDSYLPYEGKVILHNKKAHTIFVRLPAWVDRDKITCTVNDQIRHCPLVGNYLVFSDLQPADKICLQFPQPESTDTYTIDGKVYTIDLRGSTVMDIQPRRKGLQIYPHYMRQHFKEKTVPMRKVQRFIAEKIIPLQ